MSAGINIFLCHPPKLFNFPFWKIITTMSTTDDSNTCSEIIIKVMNVQTKNFKAVRNSYLFCNALKWMTQKHTKMLISGASSNSLDFWVSQQLIYIFVHASQIGQQKLLMRRFWNSKKILKIMKNVIFTLFGGVSVATVNKQTGVCVCCLLWPLSYECKPHKIRNFKRPENLRPK